MNTYRINFAEVTGTLDTTVHGFEIEAVSAQEANKNIPAIEIELTKNFPSKKFIFDSTRLA